MDHWTENSLGRIQSDEVAGPQVGCGNLGVLPLSNSHLASPPQSPQTKRRSLQVACWKGKSRLNAWKNQLVDQRTNSVQEGFRLEGVECPPQSLQDRVHLVAKGSKGPATYISPKVLKIFFGRFLVKTMFNINFKVD